MRARSIKPGICDNELLGTADPLLTLLFERLWMMADREGRLEDRPLRIKAQAFPYRDGLDVDKLLTWLHDNRFIHRYESGAKYIQVLKFSEHQKPHQNEKPSVIPAPESTTLVSSEHNQGANHLALTPSSLTPDSGLLTAPSGSGTSAAPTARKTVSREIPPEWMLDFKLAYPERSGDPNWRGAQRAAHARILEGHLPAEFLAGAHRYADFCRATGKVGTEFVQQASKFLGPSKPFLLPWTAPQKPETASERILRKLNDPNRVIDHELDAIPAAIAS